MSSIKSSIEATLRRIHLRRATPADIGLFLLGATVLLSSVAERALGMTLAVGLSLILGAMAVGIASLSLFRRNGTDREASEGGVGSESRDDRSLQEVSARFTHSLNSHLGVTRIMLELLRREEPLTPRGQQSADIGLESLDKGLKTASELSRALLDKQIPTRSAVDINALIKDSIVEFDTELKARHIDGREVSLDLRLAPVPLTEANAEQIRNVFRQLVQNALEAMPEGGKLDIASRVVNGNIIVAVTDTGARIPEGTAAKIFEPFFTTKALGSGLGLAISRAIVRGHSGDIRLVRRPNTGDVTFEVELPIVTPRPLRILVVDDERGILNSVGRIIDYGGNSVELYTDPVEAVKKARIEDFDVVIVDYRMPGITGDVIAREVKRRNPKARVILMTGFAGELTRPPAQYGFDVVVKKPFAVEQFREIVSAVSGN